MRPSFPKLSFYVSEGQRGDGGEHGQWNNDTSVPFLPVRVTLHRKSSNLKHFFIKKKRNISSPSDKSEIQTKKDLARVSAQWQMASEIETNHYLI